MKIQPKQIKVRDLYDGYKDSGDAGVVGFGGQLNIRPAYQREFVYKDEQRNKVIDTVRKGYPLNVMYWVRNPDPVDPLNDDLARFEVLDGQQRTLSIRQDYLETALKWASKGNPASYMAAHQFDKTAFDLWSYFSSVIGWVKLTFPTVRKEMKAIPWGELYDTYKGENLDPVALEVRIVELMKDEDVTRKAGIYTYVLDGNRKHLSLRAFTPNTKTEVYNRQGGFAQPQAVRSLATSLNWKRWRPTTSSLGTREARLLRRTARCFARIATVRRAERCSYPRWPLHRHRLHHRQHLLLRQRLLHLLLRVAPDGTHHLS
ncbi:MAG TPA: DUF262 domain-containing protein [Acidovorax defluvii]|jgi:hypothetical protein|nr:MULTISPECIES: DUF262 domain-containing protein [unclassified Acidovorax]HQS20581.1 DUF262 domain-containing protein [Acidovorax defluvii]HQS61948.1 DUF262 domain-containing protein [Acidovorax defluvii]HQT16215.1 DUF262 domain-containing protein [Acidovorax defluvii]HQT51276.1 DUF262 domain-containing protein [Acidovorax defluvii]